MCVCQCVRACRGCLLHGVKRVALTLGRLLAEVNPNSSHFSSSHRTVIGVTEVLMGPTRHTNTCTGRVAVQRVHFPSFPLSLLCGKMESEGGTWEKLCFDVSKLLLLEVRVATFFSSAGLERGKLKQSLAEFSCWIFARVLAHWVLCGVD